MVVVRENCLQGRWGSSQGVAYKGDGGSSQGVAYMGDGGSSQCVACKEDGGSRQGVACKGGREVNRVLLAREEGKLTGCCLQGRKGI